MVSLVGIHLSLCNKIRKKKKHRLWSIIGCLLIIIITIFFLFLLIKLKGHKKVIMKKNDYKKGINISHPHRASISVARYFRS